MGKNFKLTRRTIINQLPRAGFTHIQGQCARCGEIRRRSIDSLGWVQGLGSLEGLEKRARCRLDGAAFLRGTFGPWGEHNNYRGPR